MRLIILTHSLLPFLGITGADWTPLIKRSVPETLPTTLNPLAVTSALEPLVSTSEPTGTSIQSWIPLSTSLLSRDLVGSSKATLTVLDDEEIHQHIAERRDDASASSTSTSTESETTATMPTPTSGNNKGSSMCSSLGGGDNGPCRKAVSYFDNGTYYGMNGKKSQYTHLSINEWTSGLYAGCTAIVQCGKDNALGLLGEYIKIAAQQLIKMYGAEKCGSIYLSDGCRLTLNYCFDKGCKSD